MEVMTFQSVDEAIAALVALRIAPYAVDAGQVTASLAVPADLPRLDAVLLDVTASDGARVLAGSLLALAPSRALGGVLQFVLRVSQPAEKGE
jgi:hypothetical protein